jgi:cadmium resistance protein CadD (predicted permease)
MAQNSWEERYRWQFECNADRGPLDPRIGGESLSFGIYLIGFLIVVVGLTYGAWLAHVPAHWITVLDLVLIGIGILSAVKRTRQKDPN